MTENKSRGDTTRWALLVLLLAVVVSWCRNEAPIDPAFVRLPFPSAMPGEANTYSLNGEKLFVGKMEAPEAFAIGPKGELYTSLGNGQIVRIVDDNTFEVVARTGADHPQCGDIEMENVCGRPLGFEYMHSMNSLLVCDSYFGLMLINIENGEKKVVTNFAGGRQIKFCNSVVIDESKGHGNEVAYFTDSSNVHRNRVLYDVFEARDQGRLLAYHFATNKTEVLLDRLHFPNGLTFTYDHTALLMATTSRAQIIKYHLTGDRKGTMEMLNPNLPATPDNIVKWPADKTHTRNTYLLGCGVRRTWFSWSLMQLPMLRSVLTALLPYGVLQKAVAVSQPNKAMVLEVDENGTVLNAFTDPTGNVRVVSEALPYKGQIYVGTWMAPQSLVRFDVPVEFK
eukprot:GDKI01031903.1.p1 GENE.GDKI01031903.1~~GDKI01031903.1.p1  ORF type:complete len:396 (+),score=129.97 GDKI01031903.1:65-1252(+)